MDVNLDIMEQYSNGLLHGWAGDIAEEQFLLLKDNGCFLDFNIVGGVGEPLKKLFLWEYTRKLLGGDTKNYPQAIGDCVSMGLKNAIEYLECVEIILKKDQEIFRPVFPPYIYGASRVLVGNGQLGNEDGSTGAWGATAVIRYGVLASDEPNVPPYSGEVAKQWGRVGPPKYTLDIGKKYPIKSAARIKNWDDAVASVTNGYPLTIASNQGFEMKPGPNGFHKVSGSWPHQMVVIGIDTEYQRPYAIILNSWANVHGILKCFYTGNELPIGCLRVDKDVFVSMMRSGECYGISNFIGFPDQTNGLKEADFKLIN